MRKYELTEETKVFADRTLHRIRALKAFSDVKEGELGGWIESENNLAQDGNAWVPDNASIIWIGSIGSRNDTTTFYNSKDGNIFVACGCFYGNIDEFTEVVKNTHGNNKYAKQYELAIQLAKAKIETAEEGKD